MTREQKCKSFISSFQPSGHLRNVYTQNVRRTCRNSRSSNLLEDVSRTLLFLDISYQIEGARLGQIDVGIPELQPCNKYITRSAGFRWSGEQSYSCHSSISASVLW